MIDICLVMFFAPEFGYFAFARYRYPHDGAVGGDLGKPQSISLCHLLVWHFSNSLNSRSHHPGLIFARPWMVL